MKGEHCYYYYIICHPTIAGDSTNILLNFTIHDANAIELSKIFVESPAIVGGK